MAELPGPMFYCECGRAFDVRPIACECGADMRTATLIKVTTTADTEGTCGSITVEAAEVMPPRRRKR
jgi:hypothetical protein